MTFPLNQIVLGDSLEVMKGFPDECVDLVVSDPPYGYGFMGKDWDKAVPSVDVWRECIRVLKAGAFAFVMSSPRQDVLSQMIVRLGEAGFETGFSSIYWCYASGFPKAMNIGKAVDKRLGFKGKVVGTKITGNAKQAVNRTGEFGLWASENTSGTKEIEVTEVTSSEAKLLDGCYGGFQPKPAVEIIIVCMKPLSEKTFVDQALKNGHGVTWLDNARIPFASEQDKQSTSEAFTELIGTGRQSDLYKQDGRKTNNAIKGEFFSQRGRFPANLLISNDVLNDGKITNSHGHFSYDWKGRNPYNGGWKAHPENGFYSGDVGSFSRYFDLDSWFTKTVENLPESVKKTFPFLIVPKASKSERDKGLDGMPLQHAPTHNVEGRDLNNPKNILRPGMQDRIARNIHPTVKPLKIMSYLITLGSKPQDIVLDPFVGSGTTCLAAKILNRQWLGIDNNPEYCMIARKRLTVVPEKITTFF